jgi:RNA polymerase sigma-70 factor (ECF subfamily)
MEKLREDSHFSANALYDLELVERALKNNDQKAYKELIQHYWQLVYFMLLGMMNNNKINAEDLTIETFEKAFESLNLYSTKFAFSTWLFKIAANNAIDFIRHKKLQESTLSLNKLSNDNEGGEFSVYIKGIELNPEESIIRKQNIHSIRGIIDKLKPNYREVVELFYIEELSNKEIAKHLGLPVNTVKRRLSRARDFILTLVKHHEEFNE